MQAIAELLRHYPELALFATLSLGYFFGQFKLGSISLGTVAANGTLSRTPIMRMPCTGSTGSGQTMSMSYVFTATVP